MRTTFAILLTEVAHLADPPIRFLKISPGYEIVIRPEVWKDLLELLPDLEELAYVPGGEEDRL